MFIINTIITIDIANLMIKIKIINYLNFMFPRLDFNFINLIKGSNLFKVNQDLSFKLFFIITKFKNLFTNLI